MRWFSEISTNTVKSLPRKTGRGKQKDFRWGGRRGRGGKESSKMTGN